MISTTFYVYCYSEHSKYNGNKSLTDFFFLNGGCNSKIIFYIFFLQGTGFDGDQCLGVHLLQMGKKKQQILHGDPLPLTRKSYLVWVGFSAEGKTNSFIYIKEIFQEESCFMVFSPINFFIDKLFKFISLCWQNWN